MENQSRNDMIRKERNGWNDPRSTFRPCYSEGVLLRVEGSIFYNNVEMRYSMNYHKPPGKPDAGKKKYYRYRGVISAIDETGRVMEMNWTEWNAQKGNEKKVFNIEKVKQRKIQQELYFEPREDVDELVTAMQRYIGGAAVKVYNNHSASILRHSGVRPVASTLMPATAVLYYGRSFIIAKHKNASDKYIERALNRLYRFADTMEAKPLASFSRTEMLKYIEDKKFDKTTQNLFCDFWDYLLKEGLCDGGNPMSRDRTKRKLSVEKTAKRALRANSLSAEKQIRLFQYLEKDTNGKKCAVALLASGLSRKDVCSRYTTWDRLIFPDPQDPEFAVMAIFEDENAGAIHNYSRPLLPGVARILHERRAALIRENGEGSLKDWHISANQKSCAPINSRELARAANAVMRAIRIEEDVLKKAQSETADPSKAVSLLINTYERLLVEKAGLLGDPGTFNFLTKRSNVSDTTSNNYTSFTSESAQRRLYTLLKRTSPSRTIEGERVLETITEDGKVRYEIRPDKTDENVVCMGEFILEPGEEIVVYAQNGVKVVMTPEEVEERTP